MTTYGPPRGFRVCEHADKVAVFKVVEQSSAAPILDNTDRAGLPYDHRKICRFASRTAPGYRVVVAALRRYAGDAPVIVAQRWKDEGFMMQSFRMTEARELQYSRLPAHVDDARVS